MASARPRSVRREPATTPSRARQVGDVNVEHIANGDAEATPISTCGGGAPRSIDCSMRSMPGSLAQRELPRVVELVERGRGLVLDLRRTRLDRHPGLAPRDAPTRHRGQERARVDRGDAPQARRDDEARRGIARERFGWRPESVARMLVLPSTSTERRRVARHEAALGAAFPLRYDDLRAWLRRPVGAMSRILFVADSTASDPRNGRVTSGRVRAPVEGKPRA